MKKRLLAIMDESGKYLTEFKPIENKVLAYDSNWQSAFEHALKVDWDAIEDDEENTELLKRWAHLVRGKLVVIEMDYQVVELETGEKREEYIKPDIDGLKQMLMEVFKASASDTDVEDEDGEVTAYD